MTEGSGMIDYFEWKNQAMYINPSNEQQQAFATTDLGKPLFMLNLLKFGENGWEKYQTYMKAVDPLLKSVGGEVIWSGKPLLSLIGPEDEGLWDMMLVVKYPNKMALAQLGGDPDYPGHLRADALEDSRLIACEGLDL